MEDDDEIDAMLSQVLRKRKPLRARDDFCRHLIPAFAGRRLHPMLIAVPKPKPDVGLNKIRLPLYAIRYSLVYVPLLVFASGDGGQGSGAAERIIMSSRVWQQLQEQDITAGD
jgi:hypothetical protein